LLIYFINYFLQQLVWADLTHLMIGMSIISARINANVGQNDRHSDHQVSQIRPYGKNLTNSNQSLIPKVSELSDSLINNAPNTYYMSVTITYYISTIYRYCIH